MSFPLHLTEIDLGNEKISLYVPDADAVQRAWKQGSISFPYWSQVWPSSIALSTFIINNSHFVRNKKLLEMGGGLGLPSLVAAKYGTSVICTDKQEEAMEVVKASAVYLGLHNLKTKVLDWGSCTTDLDADIILLSDVNYEPAALEELSRLLRMVLKKGMTILLSTPQRLVARNFVNSFLPFCISQEEMIVRHIGTNVPITMVVLKDHAT
jgi:predicted nicotinamide N-methyase